MGGTSFGKGLVQAVYVLENGYGLILKVAKYLTPRGTDINKVGIVPDVSWEDALLSAPVFFPVVGSDNSRVDFDDVLRRLDPTIPFRKSVRREIISTKLARSSFKATINNL